MDSVVGAFARVRPDAVVNCIGIIKQFKEAHEYLPSITINALFPHRLTELARATGTQMIHVSTDCVFSGRKGSYTESDVPDAEDLYGRTKHLGEVTGPGCLTLRTSIVGRGLRRGPGLIDWFVSQRGGIVNGYARVIYSGLTTLVFGEVIADVLERHPDLEGLWQVSSDPISKYELLGLANQAMGLGIQINRDETIVNDRSLDSSRFQKRTGFKAPAWPEMIASMASDSTGYDAEFK
jgi:dTDP-4-dehydrorhamnose reductase